MDLSKTIDREEIMLKIKVGAIKCGVCVPKQVWLHDQMFRNLKCDVAREGQQKGRCQVIGQTALS